MHANHYKTHVNPSWEASYLHSVNPLPPGVGAWPLPSPSPGLASSGSGLPPFPLFASATGKQHGHRVQLVRTSACRGAALLEEAPGLEGSSHRSHGGPRNGISQSAQMFQLQQMFAQEPWVHMCVYVREGGCEVCAQVSLCVEEVVGMHSGCMWKAVSVCPESPPGGWASLPGFYCAMYRRLPIWDLIQPPQDHPMEEAASLHVAVEDTAAELSHLSKVTRVRSGDFEPCLQVYTRTADPCSHLGQPGALWGAGMEGGPARQAVMA